MDQLQDIGIAGHLEELRKRLIISLISIALLTSVSFLLSDVLIALITVPVKQSVESLYFLSPYEAFMVKLKASLVSGVILSLPVIFSQLWLFISPGLYSKEQRIILPLMAVSTLLFVMGALFAYFIVIPLALKFFLGFQTTALIPLISIDSYLSFFISIILIFGIVFDFPVLLLGLISLGVVGVSFLSEQRRVIIVLLFILAAVLTPTVDVFTQCLLAVPLWILFEVSIWIGRRMERRRGIR